ncbi:hypothetical protein FB45DRAFT_936539 [Roridomyces roridus]|uniref:Uncharacterized protein n=1 Tax=Roridomyces roridus TaxID=1738132 RepID=A0AAD7BA58_9AGAR|nr:hypothetical protein FB45DRAFT_936539 [Roridomyces roridus]
MSEGRFFQGRAADVAGWNTFCRPAGSNKRSFFRKRPTTPMAPQQRPVGAPNGSTGPLDLSRIYSVSLHTLSDPNPDSANAYTTLFVFNADLVDTLYLNTSHLPTTLLSDVLPMLDFPFLTHVVVPAGIEPASMTDFLLRHSRLQVFEHAEYYGGQPTLTTHPIAHPGLLVDGARILSIAWNAQLDDLPQQIR